MKSVQVKVVSLVLSTLMAGSLLSGCGGSETASGKSDPVVREANCQLIYDWMDYRQAPENEDFWYTQVNTYDFYTLIEERVFSQIKDGDSSYDTIVELRGLQYDQNLFNTPPIGTPVTESTYKQHRKDDSATKDSFMPEEDQWKIINSLSSSCSRFTADQFAEEFAYVLVMDK